MGKNLHQGSRTGVIFIEYKKGDKEDIANHLSISLLNLDYKIYTAVLKNRMQETLNAIIGKKKINCYRKQYYISHTFYHTLCDMSNTLIKQLAVIFWSQGGLGFYFFCSSYVCLPEQINSYDSRLLYQYPIYN